MSESGCLERDGVALVYRDFGGSGPPVVLLHGLAGHSAEWTDTASWLVANHRVVTLDARGHGGSEREPRDVSLDAHAADVACVIEHLLLGPVVLVGQSLGGLTAILVAAHRPELVRGLVVVEASPAGGDHNADRDVAALGESLRTWPVPFPTRDAALRFFAERHGSSLAAEAWASGLEHRDDGWWPRFEPGIMTRMLRASASRSYWNEWTHIVSPTLIITASAGSAAAAGAKRMTTRLPHARLVQIPGAAHDVHLDRPREWREALTSFLRSLQDARRPRLPPNETPRTTP